MGECHQFRLLAANAASEVRELTGARIQAIQR